MGSLYLRGLSLLLFGCSSASQNVPPCSGINSVGVSGSPIQNALRDGTLAAGWGGVLDLIEEENPAGNEKVSRQRCTVHMDLFSEKDQEDSSDPARFAFWTAEHCLKFANVMSAELSIFDPTTKKYTRFPVRLDELEHFLKGKKLFEQHAPTRMGDYLAAAARPSRGLIERGIPSCKTDSQRFLVQNPDQSVICSSVLDLVRLEGRVHESAVARHDVKLLLLTMSIMIRLKEIEQRVNLGGFSSLVSPQQMRGVLFWLDNWRTQVSKLSRLRGAEGFAPLIEEIRTTCPGGGVDNLCHPEIRSYFSHNLKEYDDAGATDSYLNFLRSVLSSPIDGERGNLAWLLHSQRSVEQLLPLIGAASLGTNFTLPSPQGKMTHKPTDTLGTKGPLFYAAAPISLLRSGENGELRSDTLFKEKTVLYSYDRRFQQGESFFMQPGDSGSVVVVGNMPIGVVSTVNGAETSGGAAVLPLPEAYGDQEDAPAVNSKRRKEVVSTCK